MKMSAFPESLEEDEQLAFDSFLTSKKVFSLQGYFSSNDSVYCKYCRSYATVTVLQNCLKRNGQKIEIWPTWERLLKDNLKTPVLVYHPPVCIHTILIF